MSFHMSFGTVYNVTSVGQYHQLCVPKTHQRNFISEVDGLMPPLNGSGRWGLWTASRRLQAVLVGSGQPACRHLCTVLSDASWPPDIIG